MDEDSDEEGEGVPACEQMQLPAKKFEGLWESLIYETSIKSRLLQFAHTAMLFAEMKVNPNLISCNRVVLLHGPPGTGKTALCKALAQKLSIRLSGKYKHAELLEINAHSLFSKWFSESGKLILKLFKRIQTLVDDKESLVCLLIDEVESLAAARKSGTSSEPSDAIRAVNALLTNLDKLKTYENVCILTTSNITEAIDLAFVDRADIKQFIGLPNLEARYEILRSCLDELSRVKVIVNEHKDEELLPEFGHVDPSAMDSEESKEASWLCKIAEAAKGLSGRALRKLPFQAHSFYIQTRSPVTLAEFLAALEKGVTNEQASREMLKQQREVTT